MAGVDTLKDTADKLKKALVIIEEFDEKCGGKWNHDKCGTFGTPGVIKKLKRDMKKYGRVESRTVILGILYDFTGKWVQKVDVRRRTGLRNPDLPSKHRRRTKMVSFGNVFRS